MTYDPRAVTDVSGLAAKVELDQKANASTVGGLATAVNSKASQSALEAVAASIPAPASTMPPAVAESGSAGDLAPYARANHTHGSKARKAKAQVVNTSTFTWVYPTPFAVGTVPVISAIAQVANGNTDLFNVQVMGSPTHLQCILQVNRVSSGLLSLLLGALSINPTPASITLHLIALEP